MTSADISIASLTEHARNGDHSAYEQLIRLTSNRIRGLVYRRLRYHELGDDIVQEAYITAWFSLRELREPSHFGAWLYRITDNLCLRELRKQAAHHNIIEQKLKEPDISAPSAEEEVFNQLNRESIRTSLLAVPEPYRSVLLQQAQGTTIRELAIRYNVAEGTIKSRLHRGRRMLMEAISSMKILDLIKAVESAMSTFEKTAVSESIGVLRMQSRDRFNMIYRESIQPMDPNRSDETIRLLKINELGAELFQTARLALLGHWAWFALNDARHSINFSNADEQWISYRKHAERKGWEIATASSDMIPQNSIYCSFRQEEVLPADYSALSLLINSPESLLNDRIRQDLSELHIALDNIPPKLMISALLTQMEVLLESLGHDISPDRLHDFNAGVRIPVASLQPSGKDKAIKLRHLYRLYQFTIALSVVPQWVTAPESTGFEYSIHDGRLHVRVGLLKPDRSQVDKGTAYMTGIDDAS